MEYAYLVIAHVLLLSGLAVVLGVSLHTNRKLNAHLQHEQNAYHQLLQSTEAKPPSTAGKTFVLSDQEIAQREKLLMATSRQRASVLDADARARLTRTFRRGSRSSRAN